MPKGRPFLTARWESLLMLNYACPAELLLPHLPVGVELDPWEGEFLISVVGFMFLDTKVMGVSFPGHRDFEEVNLRFYVRRTARNGEVRRGVVFVRELVPKPLIAWTARTLYEEPYLAVPMGHRIDLLPETGGSVEYTWSLAGNSYLLKGRAEGPAMPLQEGSEEEFITEHYWGYTKRSKGPASEYHVAHPKWRVWRCSESSLTGDLLALYGTDFARVMQNGPRSALLAVGSESAVYPGHRLSSP